MKKLGFISTIIALSFVFMAGWFAKPISDGWVIMLLMFFASFFGDLSKQCFNRAKKPKFYIVPVTRDMVDENGNLKEQSKS